MQIQDKVDTIVAYAPPAKSGNKDTTEEEKQFYDELQDMMEDTPQDNRLILSGDVNATETRTRIMKRERH